MRDWPSRRAPISACRFMTRRSCGSSGPPFLRDRKSTRLNSSHLVISYAVFCLKKKILPREEAGDAEGAEVGPDPREELIRRLLEYQKYKRAAQDLAALPQLGRGVFARRTKEEVPLSQEEVRFLPSPEVGVYRRLEALAGGA